MKNEGGQEAGKCKKMGSDCARVCQTVRIAIASSGWPIHSDSEIMVSIISLTA